MKPHMRLALALGATTSLGFAYGVLGYRNNWFPISTFREIQDARRTRMVEEQFRALSGSSGQDQGQTLAALGYASGYETAGAMSGIQVAVPAEMEPGCTLLYSSHDPRIFAVNDSGDIIFEQKTRADEIWPDFTLNTSDPWQTPQLPAPPERMYPRRAQIADNGDILVLFEYFGLARISRSGEVVWKTNKNIHHDFELLPDGRTVTLGRRNTSAAEIAERFPGTVAPVPVFEDFILIYSENGEEVESISILDAILNSEIAHAFINSMLLPSNSWLPSTLEHFRGMPPLEANNGMPYDWLHANSVRLTGNGFLSNQTAINNPAWIVSLRTPSLIVAIDCATGIATWIGSGCWIGQHQATPLETGTILLLDNQGGTTEGGVNGNRSRVIEVEVPSCEIRWSFPAEDGYLYTQYQGFVERLKNGNTLISETGAGRALEVTQAGKVVWEWISPFRNPDDPEQVATLLGAHRISQPE